MLVMWIKEAANVLIHLLHQHKSKLCHPLNINKTNRPSVQDTQRCVTTSDLMTADLPPPPAFPFSPCDFPSCGTNLVK